MPEKPKGNQNGSQPENSTSVEFSFNVSPVKHPARFEHHPLSYPGNLRPIGRTALQLEADQVPPEIDTGIETGLESAD